MRCASMIVVLLLACSKSTEAPREPARDAGEDAARDAGEDAARDAGEDAARDAGEDAGLALRRCSVEGCNGETDAISSAAGCPLEPPALETECALDDGASCFYCEPGEEQLSIAFGYPAYICEAGTWVFEELFSACD